MNRYMGCGASYKFHYIEKYRSTVKSSALVFGSAIDAGCNYMLENFERKNEPDFLSNAIQVFADNWIKQYDKDTKSEFELRSNPQIKYFKSDFDINVLTDDDKEELGLDNPEDIKSHIEFRKEIENQLKDNKNDWTSIDLDARLDYNEVTWFCLLRKGELMLTAYYTEILPMLKRILTLQRNIELQDEEGNVVNGIAEFVAELQDGRIVLIDNKTSGSEYAPDSVENSQQLALYKQILNIQASSPDFEWKTPIEYAGYAVMSKSIKKESVKTCTVCGHISNTSHKTCNNVVNGVRCDGDWTVVTSLSSSTQFIIDKISDKFGESVLENASTIVQSIKKGIFPKNFNKCADDYGAPCQFINICHKGDKKNLFKLDEIGDKNGKKTT